MGPDLQIAELTRSLEVESGIYAIHYACEGFYQTLDHPPEVSAVSIRQLPSGEAVTFSRTDDPNSETAEQNVLVRLFDWLGDHPDARLIHWNMSKTDFGFTALDNRFFHVLGRTAPTRHAQDRLFNLDELVKYRHGTEYAQNPRLPTLVSLNGLATRYSLSGPEQADRFRDGKHADLARCTDERAHHIGQLAVLFVEGRLQTERSGPGVRFAGGILDSVDLVVALGNRLVDAAGELMHRRGGKATIALSDEYDYQDILRSVLRLFFDDVRPEDVAPAVAGGTSRIDFILPDVGLAVELKVTRDSLDDRTIGEELIVDITRYRSHKDVRHLVCLVFDSTRVLRNPKGLESDLSQTSNGLAVTVRVFR